jgi:hypothetical protein
MPYADEVQAMAGDHVRLHESGGDGTLDLGLLLAFQPPGTVVYVCGPGRMIDALRGIARARSWTENRIRFEVFNAAHRPEGTDFSVRLRYGQTIPVGAGTHHPGRARGRRCGHAVRLPSRRVRTLPHRRRRRSRRYRPPRQLHDRRGMRCQHTQLTICCSRAMGPLIDLDLT